MKKAPYDLLFILLVYILSASNLNWGGERWKDIIASDGKGYYAYLPALFIYKDSQFGFHDSIEKKYYSPMTWSEYRVQDGAGGTVNKYFIGTALLQLPFFLAGHLIATGTAAPVDGYSFPYQCMINLAGIFYALAGLWMIRNLLKGYGIKPLPQSLTLLAIAFGTPLFYYAVIEPSMSHVYSFMLVSAFIISAKKLIDQGISGKRIFLLSLITGLLLLVRPVNGILLFSLPFLAGSREQWNKRVTDSRQHFFGILAGSAIVLTFLCLQSTAWFVQCGRYFVYAYGNERIEWLQPHMLDFLFSYKKGFFLYTPVALLALFGLNYFIKEKRWLIVSWSAFILVVVYVLSSWNVWWYGGSFSQRAMIEYLPFFAIPFALLLNNSGKTIRISASTTAIVLILLCQFQTMQYRYYLIHWEKMDKEHYWRVFLRTDGMGKGENPNRDLLE